MESQIIGYYFMTEKKVIVYARDKVRVYGSSGSNRDAYVCANKNGEISIVDPRDLVRIVSGFEQ